MVFLYSFSVVATDGAATRRATRAGFSMLEASLAGAFGRAARLPRVQLVNDRMIWPSASVISHHTAFSFGLQLGHGIPPILVTAAIQRPQAAWFSSPRPERHRHIRWREPFRQWRFSATQVRRSIQDCSFKGGDALESASHGESLRPGQ